MTKRAPLSFNSERVKSVSAVPVAKTGLRANETTTLHTNDATHKQENVVRQKRANKDGRVGRSGRQFIAAHIVPEAAKQFKLLAVQHDKTTQELLIEAINDLFAKHGLSRIAG
jgi:hypothetical protein